MLRWCCFLLPLAALASGCGKGERLPPLHPVTGQVVKNGVPVAGGSVTFTRIEDQSPLMINSLVDDTGRFDLATIQERNRLRGAPIGEYRVVYSPAVLGKDAFPIEVAKLFQIAAGTNNFQIDLGLID